MTPTYRRPPPAGMPPPARFAAAQALRRLKGLWKTLVMLVLRSNGPRRFAHLERELPPISAKVLAQRLRELERDGFVARRGPSATRRG